MTDSPIAVTALNAGDWFRLDDDPKPRQMLCAPIRTTRQWRALLDVITRPGRSWFDGVTESRWVTGRTVADELDFGHVVLLISWDQHVQCAAVDQVVTATSNPNLVTLEF